ncbi:hypothetical protein [Ruminiclostridium papyrosolvens]|uniref:Uncharacterized protein n=1 Tax=Ruminiclostridium papyrosolvens C7 TaxID=1330534 RepID=U4R7D8_9FIRM|nr:hypothetical protein [Ruminiclostridium papyrosolvens]EPR14443.1 hypothetical protein L323_01000 [Ruminiclostridium papyrosolvens C7]
MDRKFKQCIFNIVGYFILAVGIVDFINASCGAKLSTIVWTRAVPGIILVMVGVIFIRFGKKVESETDGDVKSIQQKQLKSCENLGIGLLYIIYFFRCLFILAISQTTYILEAFYNTPVEFKKKVMASHIQTLFLNIPITIVYVLCIIWGIYLMVRGKKGLSLDSEVLVEVDKGKDI